MQHKIYVSPEKEEQYRRLPKEKKEQANRKAQEAFYRYLEEKEEEE